MLLVDRLRKRMDSADHAPSALAEYERLRPVFIGVEKATYGLTLITNLQRSGVPVRALDADKDKVTRAIPAGNFIDVGRIYFPEGAMWLPEWESELDSFPNGRHDDQADTIAYAALQLAAMPMPRAPRADEERTADAKAARHLARMDKKKRRVGKHPDMGRM
jgi:predicted phage terminase large subunit-like protein